MNLEIWAQLAEVAAAVGVLISILYLAAQVRQSNVVARGEARRAWMTLTQNELHRIVEDPDIYHAYNAEAPSGDSKVRMLYFIVAALRRTEFEWLEHRDGLIDRDQFEAYAAAIPVILGTPRAREMWAGMRVVFLPTFAEYVDGILETAPLMDDKWFSLVERS